MVSKVPLPHLSTCSVSCSLAHSAPATVAFFPPGSFCLRLVPLHSMISATASRMVTTIADTALPTASLLVCLYFLNSLYNPMGSVLLLAHSMTDRKLRHRIVKGTCPRSDSWEMAELGFEPGSLTLNHCSVQLAQYTKGDIILYPLFFRGFFESSRDHKPTACKNQAGNLNGNVKQLWGVRQQGMWDSSDLKSTRLSTAPYPATCRQLQKGVAGKKYRPRGDFSTKASNLNF